MRERVLRLLTQVAAGEASPATALERLSLLPIEEVGENGAAPFARLDHHRSLRQGHPEVVFGPGKTPDQLVEICHRFDERGDGFLVTRLDSAATDLLVEQFPAGEANPAARTFHHPGPDGPVTAAGTVLVLTGGTGDIPVAEEAAVTAAAFGNPVDRLYDVGVAGIHRVLGETARLREAAVLIVVAGMEGALPSVVGGLVRAPVIAVPTSVGYGAAFGGIAALLGMLNSCAGGVTVVNIDNGFGAAVAATRINQVIPVASADGTGQGDSPRAGRARTSAGAATDAPS